MKSQKPINGQFNQDGTTTLRDFSGKEIGTIKDPQDADTIVEAVNSTPHYGQGGDHP